ncbi:hypothetical protein D3C84_636010 [compost metagenome]
MRVVRLGKGVDIGLEDVFGAGLVQTRELVLVAFGQQLLDRLGLFAGDFQAQDFIFDTFAPEVVEFGLGLDPGRVLTVDQQGLFGGEVEVVDALVQLGKGEVQTRFDPVQITLVDGEAGIEIATFEEIVELGLPLVELGDVTGQEIAAGRIEQLDVAVVDDHRARIVERRLAVVVALEQLDHVEAGDHFIAIGLEFIPAVGGPCIARQRQTAQTDQQCKGGAWQKMLHADST